MGLQRAAGLLVGLLRCEEAERRRREHGDAGDRLGARATPHFEGTRQQPALHDEHARPLQLLPNVRVDLLGPDLRRVEASRLRRGGSGAEQVDAVHRCGRAERGPLHLQPVVELAIDAHAHRRDQQQRRRRLPGWRTSRCCLHTDAVALPSEGDLDGAEWLGRWRGRRNDNGHGTPQGWAARQQRDGDRVQREHRRRRHQSALNWRRVLFMRYLVCKFGRTRVGDE